MTTAKCCYCGAIIPAATNACVDAHGCRSRLAEQMDAIRAEVERLQTLLGVEQLRLKAECDLASKRIKGLESEVERLRKEMAEAKLKAMPVGLFTNPEALLIHQERLRRQRECKHNFEPNNHPQCCLCGYERKEGGE